MHEPHTPAQREAHAALAGAAAHLIQEWAEVDERGKRHLVISLGQSLRQLNTAEAAAEQPDAQPEWCRLETHNPDRGLTDLPPVEDQHGQLPTGYTRVRQSSAVDGALWVDAAEYGGDLESRLARMVAKLTTLHFRPWQARRLAYQLLAMAEHVDPGGGTDPTPVQDGAW